MFQQYFVKMSTIYDNWERLVKATLLREELRWLSRQDSLSSTSSSQFTWSFRDPNFPILNSVNMGISFSYQQISRATDFFSDQNLLKRGHSGNLFTGFLPEHSTTLVVVKRFHFQDNWEALFSELEFFSRIFYGRFVPLLGYCLETENEKFLVYRYLEKRDLASSLFYRTDSKPDSLNSLDWITRLKIAIGVAEALTFLHHYCNPPLAHGDVQASSVILDRGFEVRLGSLNQVSAQVKDCSGDQVTLPWKSAEDNSGGPKGTCADDVYCLGKVLMELVTGNLGLSSSEDATLKDWLGETLAYVNIHSMKLITKIVDPTLIIGEDLLKEVRAVAIVARCCLNPNPTRRPLVRDIFKALENPTNVVVSGEHDSRTPVASDGHNPSNVAVMSAEPS